MLATDELLLGSPCGDALYRAIQLHDRTMRYMLSLPKADRPRREQAIKICKASSRLWSVRSSRFRHNINALP